MPSKHKKTKLTVSLDVTPIKKQKQSYCNFLDIVEVQAPHLCIGVPTRADKPESPYLKPIIDAASWKVLKITTRKGEKNSDGRHSFVPKAPGSRIPWNIFVLYKDGESIDSKSIGKHLSTELTKFVQDCPKVRELY